MSLLDWLLGRKPAAEPARAPAATPVAKRFTNITATEFGGKGDANASAYGGMVDPDKPGVALPYHFMGARPRVRVWRNGRSVDCDIVDVGPWYPSKRGGANPYWEFGARPRAESDGGTNHAGIDLTPAAWTALGAAGTGLGKVDWEFIGTNAAPVPAPAPAPSVAAAKSVAIGSDRDKLQNVQHAAAKKLLKYDGEIYPHDGCAITLSVLLQEAGLDVPDTYQAIALGALLKTKGWQVIAVGKQQAGDVGSTCGPVAHHGTDHIYLVLRAVNADEMLIADNQATQPHARWASGQGGKSPTTFFLRAP